MLHILLMVMNRLNQTESVFFFSFVCFLLQKCEESNFQNSSGRKVGQEGGGR